MFGVGFALHDNMCPHIPHSNASYYDANSDLAAVREREGLRGREYLFEWDTPQY